MTTSSRPWAPTLTARLSRAHDLDTVEIVEYGHGEFTRRLLGPGGPLAQPAEPLDDADRRELLEELRAELGTLPSDIRRDDVTGFMHLLETSFAMVPTP